MGGLFGGIVTDVINRFRYSRQKGSLRGNSKKILSEHAGNYGYLGKYDDVKWRD